MNQINFIKKPSPDLIDNADFCEHAEQDHKLVDGYWVEKDSFSVVGVYGVCTVCKAEQYKTDSEELVQCEDCGKMHQRKQGIRWRPYYFCARDGSEPLCICLDCKDKPKHIERCKQDELDYNKEMGWED